ncbi:sensor histidine kinase [Streptomyces sp. NPDC059740]|uniref:sensor histidine kinase n=1 Tax=Streptomyces sp. NPDC059740 TaxID=3346926 RepID=UPI0036541198
MRLSTRVALAVGVAVPLMVLASGFLLLQLVGRDQRHEQDTALRDRATAVSRDARGLLRAAAADRDGAEQARQRDLLNSTLDIGLRLVGPQGTFAGGPQPASSLRLPRRAVRPVTVRSGTRSWRALSVHVGGAGAGGPGTLWLFSPDAPGEARLRLVRRRVLLSAVLAAPVSALLAWGIATGATRPLRRLQRRTSGLDPRLPATRLTHRRTGVTEVDELAAVLDSVLARYDEQAARTGEALETARSFSSAAAHEMRTPLMSMGTNLDILDAHPDLPAAEREEVVTDLRHEHTRLLGLLTMLRALGRGDLVEADTFGPVDLAQVCGAAVAEARRRGPGACIELSAARCPAVHGWEPGLRTAVDNLLANCLVHGRDGAGEVAVEVTVVPGGPPTAPEVVVSVEDHGQGVEPERRQEVFARFRRGPGSPGSGLGLTLVAQQAALHQGSVTVEDRLDGLPGARFVLRLPVGRAPGAPAPRRDWLLAAGGRDTAGPPGPSHGGDAGT